VTLPETLTVLDVEDLMTSLGRPSDRTAIARALAQTEIEGVVAPRRRGEPWRIPAASLVDVVAAILRRRDARAAAAARMPIEPLQSYRVPAARLLARRADLARVVPQGLRRQIAADERKRREAADAAARLRQAAAERERQREARVNAAELARLQDLARLHLYFDARVAATAARFPKLDRDTLNSAEFADFMLEWPYPADRPSWWQPPPGALDAAVELIRPWVIGKTRECPRLEHLLPRKINYSQPWPWRREPTNAS
jgi:hypothetical protein